MVFDTLALCQHLVWKNLMKSKYIPLLAFFYITVTSSAFFSISAVGDSIEHLIKFISPMIMFLVIIALFSKYRNSNPFTKSECRYIAIAYVSITVLDYLYPVFRYWDQDFGSEHYTLFIFELGINAAIARVILK